MSKPTTMATLKLNHIMKIYPHSGDYKKRRRKERKKTNLQVTDRSVVAVQEFSLDIADNEFIVLVVCQVRNCKLRLEEDFCRARRTTQAG